MINLNHFFDTSDTFVYLYKQNIKLGIAVLERNFSKMTKCNAILPPDFNFPVLFIFLFLNIGTSLVTIIGNFLVMVVLLYTSKLKTRSNYFLSLLAATDLAVGLVAQRVACLLVIDVLDMSQICSASNIEAYICNVLCDTSIGMLALIGYDRYLHLSKLQNYNKYMTNRKLKVLISIIFAYQTLAGCLIFHEDTVDMFLYFVISHVGTCSTVLFFYYCKSWKTAKKGIISTTNSRMKKYWKMAKSMALLVLVFVVCWTPFFLYMSIQQFCQFMEINFEKKFYPENLKIFHFCLLCSFANSRVNPFLYYWRNKNIRLGIQSLIMNKLCRKKGKVTDGKISKMIRFTSATDMEYSEKRSIEIDSKNSSSTSIKKMKLQLFN